MKPETVEKWTHTIDTFKIIPRALILMWMYLTYSVIFWFMSLDLPTFGTNFSRQRRHRRTKPHLDFSSVTQRLHKHICSFSFFK